MNEAKAIKKHAAQHDLFNRLHSIAADERFVRKVAHDWYADRFEVIANQRCGTWYCDPDTSSKTYAYFKSTDGHTLNWDFNLRRSNLSLATHAEEVKGIILVDSTRRGKRMPDGLSKTVPIWCCVVNRALKLRRDHKADTKTAESDEWDTTLYLPAIVSPSERSQIESRLDGWAASLEGSVLPLPELTKPLRPFFIHPATTFAPQIDPSPPFTPVVCVSASRWVNGDDGRGDPVPTATRLGDGWFAKTVAFDYVPGAGDDDELWGRGLKPSVYHERKDTLLTTDRDDLPEIVDEIVEEAKELSSALAGLAISESSAITSATVVTPALALDLGETSQPAPPVSLLAATSTVLLRVYEVEKPPKDTPAVLALGSSRAGPVILFAAPSARSHGKEYLSALTALVDHLESYGLGSDTALVMSPGSRAELDAALKLHADEQQEPTLVSDLSEFPPAQRLTQLELQSTRKTIIPLAVALRNSIPGLGGDPSVDLTADKKATAAHLHALVALWPDGNPPRAALKRVNEFLMSEARD